MRECQRFALVRTDTAVNLSDQPQNIVVRQFCMKIPPCPCIIQENELCRLI